MTNVDTDVLIVGAGPVGLFLANAELRVTRRPGMTLVRPDGYIAFASDDGNSTTALEALRSVLQRQTIPPPAAERVA
jgi:hypothetical protein